MIFRSPFIFKCRAVGSLKNQQRIITGYSHARQIEVVASLDTADVMEPTNPTDGDFRPDSTPSEDNREEEGERGEHKEEAAETINCSGGAAADDAVVDSQEPAGDACEASLSRISLETDMVRTLCEGRANDCRGYHAGIAEFRSKWRSYVMVH